MATKSFKRHDFIAVYDGEIMVKDEAELLEAVYKEDPNIGSFMYFFYHKGVDYW